MGRARSTRRERRSRRLTFRLRCPAGPSSLSSFRSKRRRLGAWAAALAVLAALALAAPAVAHQLLVGNFDQGAGLTVDYGASDVAQGFITGSNPNGYLLDGVQLQVFNLATGMTAKVATGLPGNTAEVATLTAAVAPGSGGGHVYFIAPADTRLAADRTYWVVLQGSSGKLSGTSSHAEDAESTTGWSIANYRLVRTSGTTGPFSEVSGTDSGPIRMLVVGHANAATATSDKSHFRYATGNKTANPTGLSTSLNGNDLPELGRAAQTADATHFAPQGDRPGRSTDSGANSGTLIRSAGMTP